MEGPYDAGLLERAMATGRTEDEWVGDVGQESFRLAVSIVTARFYIKTLTTYAVGVKLSNSSLAHPPHGSYFYFRAAIQSRRRIISQSCSTQMLLRHKYTSSLAPCGSAFSVDEVDPLTTSSAFCLLTSAGI
jgi:hypothetical protein